MKVAIGSDHRGLEQRKIIGKIVAHCGYPVIDCGTFSQDSVDYPDIAAAVAREVATGQAQRGILLCGTGIGVCIAANKIPGIRAAVCWSLDTVRLSRQHNDANVLCLSAELFQEREYHDMVTLWLSTPFDGGRHQQRIEKIRALEDGPIDS